MKIKNLVKKYYHKHKYGETISISLPSYIYPASQLEGYNRIGKDVSFCGVLGRGSYIGKNSIIFGKIGKFCSISSHVTVLTGNHPAEKFVSTSPSFYSTKLQNNISFVDKNLFQEYKYADTENKHHIIVGNDVWIGHGVTIMSGITIGDGAVLAAEAVVTKDVPPYTIVGGVPAKEIKKRFDDKTIKFLLQFKWWDKPIEWINENSHLFTDIKLLMDKYGEVDI